MSDRKPFASIQVGNVKAEVFERWFEKMFGKKPTRSTIPLYKKSDFSKDKIVLVSGEAAGFTWKVVLPRDPNQQPSRQ